MFVGVFATVVCKPAYNALQFLEQTPWHAYADRYSPSGLAPCRHSVQ